MTLVQLLSGPVVGAVIGYITNDIAIRMLFRPRKAIYVFGVRVPFTPGIVPRRKNQLAQILGNAIVQKFFNADDLEIVFTDGIADAVAEELLALLRSEAKLGTLAGALPPETPEALEREVCIRMQAAVAASALPEQMAERGLEMAASLLDGPAGRLALEQLPASFPRAMGGLLRSFVLENGRELILPLLRREEERLSGAGVGELSSLLLGADDDALRAHLKALYLRFMARHVRPIVESIDVGGMIAEKIVLMSPAEVEDLVLTVVRRELRLVVLFGAFVGALIGAVNLFL